MLLNQQPDMCIVGEAKEKKKVLDLINILKPDLAIIIIMMPSNKDVEMIFNITYKYSTKVIAFIESLNREYIERIRNAGAFIFILNDKSEEEFITYIQAVMKNDINDDNILITEELENDNSNIYYNNDILANLSKLEKEILIRIARGDYMKEIAVDLNMSYNTVRVHKQYIMSKLDIKKSVDLIKYAIKMGLTSVD
jgi:DNA-binding NarL/FixJ family response regulator